MNASQSFQTGPDLRQQAVTILSATANDCLMELGYYPGMHEKYQQAIHDTQRLQRENSGLKDALRMPGTRELCEKLLWYQDENVKLWEDNRRLNAHNNSLMRDVDYLWQSIRDAAPTLYEVLMKEVRNQSYRKLSATVPHRQSNHPEADLNARPRFNHQRAPPPINTSSHSVPPTPPLTGSPLHNPYPNIRTMGSEPAPRISAPLQRSVSQPHPLLTNTPLVHQPRSFSQPFVHGLPSTQHPPTPALSNRSFSSEPVEAAAAAPSPPSIAAALVPPMKRPSISDGVGPCSKKQKVEEPSTQPPEADAEAAEEDWDEDVVDLLVPEDENDPTRRTCVLCQANYDHQIKQGLQPPPVFPFVNASNRVLLEHLKTEHKEAYFEARRQVIEQRVIQSSQ